MSVSPAASRWFVLAGVWLIYFCFGVVIASMAPLVTPVAAELELGNAAMGAILGAWPFTYILAAIPCGVLLDRFGARRMLFVCTLVMAASCIARAMAQTPLQLLLAVALFGFGGPLVSVGAPKLIAALFEGRARATAMGVYVTGPYLGSMLSLALTNGLVMPLVGGDWRAVMLVYATLAGSSGFIWLVLSRSVDSERGAGKKFDLRAFADILYIREVRLILALAVGIFFFNHGLNNWLPEILRAKGLSAAAAGYWAAIPSSVGVIAALTVPRLAIPERRLAVMAGLAGAALGASVFLQLAFGPLVMAGLVLQGIARGAMMTLAILFLMETPRVPAERLGMAGGLFFTTAEVGGVLGPLVFGILSDLSGDFTWPLAVLSAACLGMLTIVGALRATDSLQGRSRS